MRPIGVPAAWERLDLLTRALEESPIRYSRLYVVADASLSFKLPERGRKELQALVKQGMAEQVKFADERLLELAFSPQSEAFGAALVTHDYFDDFRRRYPELDSVSAVGWVTDDDGNITVATRDIGARTHLRVSRKEEESELLERRLRRREVQDRAVETYFRCVNRRCLVAQLWPDHLEELPRYDEGTDGFVCPSCGEPVVAGSARRPAVQVIVYLDGVEAFRILIEDGADLGIGRSDGRGRVGLDRHLTADRVAAVSRHHLVVSLRGEDLLISDAGSKNGTYLGRRGAQAAARVGLRAGEPTKWGLREVVFLPDGITLERSGRRLPTAGDRANDQTGPSRPSSPTTLVSE